MADALTLKYTRKASQDLEGITDYLQDQAGAAIALRFLDAVDGTAGLLLSTPNIGIACHLESGHLPRMTDSPAQTI